MFGKSSFHQNIVKKVKKNINKKMQIKVDFVVFKLNILK